MLYYIIANKPAHRHPKLSVCGKISNDIFKIFV